MATKKPTKKPATPAKKKPAPAKEGAASKFAVAVLDVASAKFPSLSELSRASGIARQSLDVMRKKSSLRLETIERLASATGIPFDDFVRKALTKAKA